MSIIKFPNPLLLKVSSFVNNDTDIKPVVESLELFMSRSPKSQGIAAPQIGVSLRIISVRISNRLITMINPTVIISALLCSSNEGCESVNGRYIVKRPFFGIVKYSTSIGKTKYKLFTKRWIRVVCHEIDHLDGILINTKEGAIKWRHC